MAIDVTTGKFEGAIFNRVEDFLNALSAYAPKEIISFPRQWRDFPPVELFIEREKISPTHLAPEYFNPRHTHIYIEKIIPTYQSDNIISLNPSILPPMGAISYYLDSTRPFAKEKKNFFHIAPFKMLSKKGLLKVTAATLEGLEILPSKKEFYSSSLLGMLDICKTAPGSRALRELLLAPSTDVEQIKARLDLVEFFIARVPLLNNARKKLESTVDLNRVMAKIATNQISARDFHGIARTIRQVQSINWPQGMAKVLFPPTGEEMNILNALAQDIEKHISEEVGASLEKGNLIRAGASRERDKFANLVSNTEQEIKKLEETYKKKTGIPSLKIKFNNVFGYFFEISKTHSAKAPSNFIRRQTMTNGERFTESELREFENKIIQAKERLIQLEREIRDQQMAKIVASKTALQSLANYLAYVDVYSTLAKVGMEEGFVRPQISSTGEERKIILRGLWHPLIKANLPGEFIPHNLTLDGSSFFALITGPNMAGKTTVMREVAIAQVLAQMGSFVPAQKAHLSLCDYLASRLGAGDDITKGQSTFMVEMRETAEIVRHATKNSLIILDEIGRGTSTYDGLSIAWALTEYLVKNLGAFTLFATHYHELIELVDSLEGAENFTVETYSEGSVVKFLYRLVKGGSAQSFGIHVAQLAGLPPSLTVRAEKILQSLERGNGSGKEKLQTALNSKVPSIPKHLDSIASALQEIDPLQITPIMALKKLEELKGLLDGGETANSP